MKYFRGITSSALVSVTILLAGCGNSSDNPTAPTPTDTVTPFIVAGNWVVSSLRQRTEDKTSQFSGYVLKFTATSAESGTVTATRNNAMVSGTWNHAPAVTYYGSSSTESLVLNLGSSSPFDRLSRTWNVVSGTNATVSLTSPEVAEDMHLVLTKQ